MTGKRSNRSGSQAIASFWDCDLPAAFADPAFRSIQNARQRRHLIRTQVAWSMLVAVWLYLTTSGLAESWFRRNLGLGEIFALVICLVILTVFSGFWVLSTGLLNASVGGATELGDRHLDEAQRSLRDAAYRKAYRFIAAAGLLFWVINLASGYPTGSVLNAMGFLVFNVVFGAPVYIMAWTMPDSDSDEETVEPGSLLQQA